MIKRYWVLLWSLYYPDADNCIASFSDVKEATAFAAGVAHAEGISPCGDVPSYTPDPTQERLICCWGVEGELESVAVIDYGPRLGLDVEEGGQ